MAADKEAFMNQTSPRQLKVVRLYIYIAWLYLLLFSPIFFLVIKNKWVTASMLIDMVILVTAQLSIRNKPDIGRVTFALATIAALTVGALVATGGIQATGFFIAFPYIPFIAFLRPRQSAERWLAGMLLFMILLQALAMAGTITLPYDEPILPLAIVMYVFTLLLTLAYVHEKTIADSHLYSTTRALVRSNDKLSLADQSQRQAIAKADAILRSIAQGVIVFDATGKVQTINQVAEKLLGISEKRLARGDYTELIKATSGDGEPIDTDNRPLNRVIATKQPVSTNLYYRRKNGTRFPAHVTIAPIIMDGKLEGAVEVFRDISVEKEIDKSKTEFVSLASHQLRTPLSTISWYSEMLLAGDAGKTTKEQHRYVSAIYDSNRRMIELVGSLLNVSRIELGTFSVDPEPTNLVKLAQDTVKDLEPQIFARKINFQEKYDPKMPVISVDPKLMRMVLENLASNAIKYTPEAGKITLSVSHRGHETHITVEDNGWGIPAAQQSRMFSKLFRADNVKVRNTQGTGLGLYLVKSIVGYSGGKIWFKSKENKGTTFFVTIPDGGMKHKQGTKELS